MHSDDEREIYTRILNMVQPYLPRHQPKEILNVEVGPPKEDKKCTPEVELKPLPSHLSYEFLSPNGTFSFNVSAMLDGTQITSFSVL